MNETTSPEVDPFIGALLDGRFRVESVLGRGGMGVVYRGRQVNVDREVAIKVLTPDGQQHEDVVKRFEREARIISKLRHPNTLKLIDFGHTDTGVLYIVSPLLEGRPLDRLIQDEGFLSPARVLNILRQVCEALVEAHQLNIVHRDLKPANIFTEVIGSQEVIKVLDFGVAKLTSETTENTVKGTTVGTPAYMSPEQIRAETTLDGRADLYSLGAVAYESLTGRRPFVGMSFWDVAMKHISTAPTLPSLLDPPVCLPAAVEELVMRMLAKHPDDRFPDATACRRAIVAIEREVARLTTGMPLAKASPKPLDANARLLATATMAGTDGDPVRAGTPASLSVPVVGPIVVPTRSRAPRVLAVGLGGVALAGLAGLAFHTLQRPDAVSAAPNAVSTAPDAVSTAPNAVSAAPNAVSTAPDAVSSGVVTGSPAAPPASPTAARTAAAASSVGVSAVPSPAPSAAAPSAASSIAPRAASSTAQVPVRPAPSRPPVASSAQRPEPATSPPPAPAVATAPGLF